MWGVPRSTPILGVGKASLPSLPYLLITEPEGTFEVNLMESPTKSGSLDLAFQWVATQPPLGYFQRWGAHYHNSEGSGHGAGHEL